METLPWLFDKPGPGLVSSVASVGSAYADTGLL